MDEIPGSPGHCRDRTEDSQAAPVAPPAMHEHNEDEAGEKQGELHLEVHARPYGKTRAPSHAHATEVFAGQDQPDRDRNQSRHRSVEQEDMEQRHQQRRAEREHDREHPRSGRPKQQPPCLIAAECEQRGEHDVLADRRRGHVDAADKHRNRAYDTAEGRIYVHVVERPEQVAGK